MITAQDIDGIVAKYPKLNFLKSPAFEMLPAEKKEFLYQCVEDALFWVDLDQKPGSSEGFKFLAATYGLVNAKEEAKSKGLEGKEKSKFLEPHNELYMRFCPSHGIDGPEFGKD